MKRLIPILITSLTLLFANEISLTPKQIKNWRIKTETIKETKFVPLGDYLSQVKAPSSMFYSVSLPFSATVEKVKTEEYDTVDKGEILASVTSKDFIEAQNALIRLNIKLKKTQSDYLRKKSLCQEGIIPQKKCLFAKAEYETVSNEFKNQKSLLRLYKLSDKEIEKIIKTGRIKKTLSIKAPVKSVVKKIFVNAGSVTEASNPLFLLISLKKKVLDADLPVKAAENLSVSDKVKISLASYEFKTKVLKKAEILNGQNQTQRVRFDLPLKDLPLNYKGDAKIFVMKKAFKIPKKAAVYISKKYYVFKSEGTKFKPIRIEIISEDKDYFYAYLPKSLKDREKIVTEGVMVLKGMAEEEND